jgi:hypothetical protein
MLRYDFYYKQLVTEQEMDNAFAGAENAIFQVSSDIKENGAFSGLDINPTSPDSTSVNVEPGVGKIESTGERISKTTATETVDASLDWNGQPTFGDLGAGEGRWCSIFVKFKRAYSDNRTDGHGNPILYISAESYEFEIYRAAKGLASAKDTLGRPGLLTTHILLSDIWFENGSTDISSADLDVTRRQDYYRQEINGSDISAGSPKEALSLLGAYINTFLGVTGADNIGSAQYLSGSTYDLAIDATVKTHLEECIDNLNDHVNTGGHPATVISVTDTILKYADGTSLGTDDLQDIFETLAQFLGTKTITIGGLAGTDKIGTNGISGTYDGTTVTCVGNVSLYTQLSEILEKVATCIQVTGDDRIAGDLIPKTGSTIDIGSATEHIDKVYYNKSESVETHRISGERFSIQNGTSSDLEYSGTLLQETAVGDPNDGEGWLGLGDILTGSDAISEIRVYYKAPSASMVVFLNTVEYATPTQIANSNMTSTTDSFVTLNFSGTPHEVEDKIYAMEVEFYNSGDILYGIEVDVIHRQLPG